MILDRRAIQKTLHPADLASLSSASCVFRGAAVGVACDHETSPQWTVARMIYAIIAPHAREVDPSSLCRSPVLCLLQTLSW